MATLIYMDGYRGFNETWVPIHQVNFLVGENSTGKTSFLELLESFARITFWIMEPSLTQGRIGERHFYDLVSASTRRREFVVGAIQRDAKKAIGMLISFRNSNGRPYAHRISVISDSGILTFDGLQPRVSGPRGGYRTRSSTVIRKSLSDKRFGALLAELHSSNEGLTGPRQRLENPGLPFLMRIPEYAERIEAGERSRIMPDLFLNHFVNLAPIRTKPRRTFDEPQTAYSADGGHVPYVIRKQLAGKKTSSPFSQYLAATGTDSGLFRAVGVREYAKDPRAPFQLKVKLDAVELGLENVGYGVSQALPVLVEMFVRPHGTYFEVQQPEVHLHPRAQATVGDVVADLARSESKGFLLETHSDFTIDRFRLNLRRNGPIDSQVLFFQRRRGGNSVTPIAIGQSGDFDPHQPPAYREFFLNESLALLS